ncbi:MAG: hypothetical protein LBQ60_22020 [Bacteroidales bacterium]|nr:hypothetical protein [Bacteroidales bacterium]
MPKYYSLTSKELDSFRSDVKTFALKNDYRVTDEHFRVLHPLSFKNKYGNPPAGGFRKVYDAHIITSEFLIDNIERAFEVWTRNPWCKSLSFSEFCEEILPYRIGNEPLENWRKAYYDMFQPLLNSLLETGSSIDAGMILYDEIMNQRWIFDNTLSTIYLGANSLLKCRLGGCETMAFYAVFVFRSVGIPAGIDFILQNPDMLHPQHFWNYMKDQSGRSIPFEIYSTPPARTPNHINRKKGKVYRICFSEQPLSIPNKYSGQEIVPLLNDKYMKDVSSVYFDNTIKIPVYNAKKGRVLYLGVFNNKKWVPIACTEIDTDNDEAVFHYVEPNIVYRPVYYLEGRFIPFTSTVIPQENGELRVLDSDREHLIQMELHRKYPMPEWAEAFKHRSVGGLFQGANMEDFSDCVTLYTITHEMDMYYHRVSVSNAQKFKYVRYFSAPKSSCNMAELQFFSNGKELNGKIIGTEGASRNEHVKTKYAVFDKDPVTYYDAEWPDNAWVGLEFETPECITEIEYLFRSDDNGIREGDVYELFYFSRGGTIISMGKKTGKKNGVLVFDNIPSNALYLLHNETRGREERVFTYENGQQVWW